MKVLEYTQWRRFENVIDKAKQSCENSGNSELEHFADVGKTIKMPKGAEKIVYLQKMKKGYIIEI